VDMNEKSHGLTQRRSELLARIAVQREEMAEIGAEWNTPLALADQGMAAVRYLRQHPLLVVGAMAIFVIRRHRVAGLMWGVWRVLKGYRDFASITGKPLSRG
jgi:hypothetical protein